MFANTKTALAFGAVVLVIAMIVSLGAGSFMPEAREPEEDVFVVDEANEPTPAPVKQETPVGWADDGNFNDWSTPDTEDNYASDASSRDAGTQSAPVFGDYTGPAGSPGSPTNRETSRTSVSKKSSNSSAYASKAPPGTRSVDASEGVLTIEE